MLRRRHAEPGTDKNRSRSASAARPTCTITNNDIAPKLHLRKLVTNNNGGSAPASAWTLTANGTGTNDLSGTTPVNSGPTLQSDTWALSESGGPSGYAASDWVMRRRHPGNRHRQEQDHGWRRRRGHLHDHE